LVLANGDWPLWVGIALLVFVVGAALFGLFVFGALGAIAGRELRRRRRPR
jgi:hypothetical protein